MKTINTNLHKISRRENQVLQLIAYERITKEIAEELFVSYETAHSHRKSLLKKLNVKNTARMVRVAYELGLLKLSMSTSA